MVKMMRQMIWLLAISGCAGDLVTGEEDAGGAFDSGADVSNLDAAMDVDADLGVDAGLVDAGLVMDATEFDGGAIADSGSASIADARASGGLCGNSVIDPGEVCDPILPDGGPNGIACVDDCAVHDCAVYARSGLAVSEDVTTHRCLYRTDAVAAYSATDGAWWRDAAERDRMVEIYRSLIPDGSSSVSGFIRLRSWDGRATWRWDTGARPVAAALPAWRSGEPYFDCAILEVPDIGEPTMRTSRCSGGLGSRKFMAIDPPGTPTP